MLEKNSGDSPFNVDVYNLEAIIDNKIKKLNILGLNEQENCNIFMICLALGVNKGLRTPLKKVKGWVRPSAFPKDYLAYIDAVALRELMRDGKENLITSTDEVHKIAEEYVNTGLLIIDEMIPDVRLADTESIALELLSKVCDVYDEITMDSENLH